MSATDQELQLSRLNEHYFFKEFTFSTTKFIPKSGSEVELADGLVWLGDSAIVFQLKSRETTGVTSVEAESKWFQNKVIRKGTKQIKDTIGFLDAGESIEIRSHSGHLLPLRGADLSRVHKLICYRANEQLPQSLSTQKFYKSSTIGVIHLISEYDYDGIVRSLMTPAEVFDYFAFREELIGRWGTDVNSVPEQALVGHYVCGNLASPPNVDFVNYLQAIDHGIDEWDVSGLIKDFPESMKDGRQSADYRAIVSEIAKLKRNELTEFKKRYLKAVEKCREGAHLAPYRFGAARTGCGFVFIPVEEEYRANSRVGLTNFTLACKYDFKFDRCIGISFIPEKDGFYSADWCYIEGTWVYDEDIERLLIEGSPFRRTRTVAADRYRFRNF